MLRTDLERELFILLKENQILKRKRRTVPLTHWDRHFYLALVSASRRLFRRIVVIRPETVLSWHRRLVRGKWAHGRQGRVGRSPVNGEIRAMVIEMKTANPRWGIQRIVGELRKVGLKICKNSVAKILREAGFDPMGPRRGWCWKNFVSCHGKRVFACDFFQVDTLFLKTLDVFLLIDITTREVVSFGVMQNRTKDWLKNHLRSVFSFADKLPGVLISDRDAVYKQWMKPFLKQFYGIELRQAPPRMPIFNCYAERLIRTLRDELTDRILIFNERDLENALRKFTTYYNSRRPHSSLAFDAPKNRLEPRIKGLGPVRRHKVLGGLVTDYALAA